MQVWQIDVYATDVSKKCIDIAKKNAELNGVKDISFLQNSDKEWLSEFDKTQTIDLIVSNPPFVPNKKFRSKEYKLQFPAVKYQPEQALRTFDEEGISPFIQIYKNARKLNTKKIFFRLDPDFFDEVRRALENRGATVKRIYDTKGIFRFIEVDTNYG